MAHVSTRWAGDIAILAPRGYLMGGTETDALAEAIDELLAAGNRKLVIDLIERRLPVRVEQHSGYWLDIGRPDDYEKAIEDWPKLCAAVAG